jgi:hypothetical protein
MIGPFIFADATVTGTTYLDVLENCTLPQIPQGCFFQQDGAPPHYANIVTNFLNEQFPYEWIESVGSNAWPPRSPDFAPLDFFFWGYTKDIVY